MTDSKKQLRPEIPTIKKMANSSFEENFQNDILRPIIKLQHDLILSNFEHNLARNKINFDELNITQKTKLIEKLFKVDIRFKSDIRGLIIGLLTLEEYKDYLNHSPQLNKRINNMIQQRIESCYN